MNFINLFKKLPIPPQLQTQIDFELLYGESAKPLYLDMESFLSGSYPSHFKYDNFLHSKKRDRILQQIYLLLEHISNLFRTHQLIENEGLPPIFQEFFQQLSSDGYVAPGSAISIWVEMKNNLEFMTSIALHYPKETLDRLRELLLPETLLVCAPGVSEKISLLRQEIESPDDIYTAIHQLLRNVVVNFTLDFATSIGIQIRAGNQIHASTTLWDTLCTNMRRPDLKRSDIYGSEITPHATKFPPYFKRNFSLNTFLDYLFPSWVLQLKNKTFEIHEIETLNKKFENYFGPFLKNNPVFNIWTWIQVIDNGSLDDGAYIEYKESDPTERYRLKNESELREAFKSCLMMGFIEQKILPGKIQLFQTGYQKTCFLIIKDTPDLCSVILRDEMDNKTEILTTKDYFASCNQTEFQTFLHTQTVTHPLLLSSLIFYQTPQEYWLHQVSRNYLIQYYHARYPIDMSSSREELWLDNLEQCNYPLSKSLLWAIIPHEKKGACLKQLMIGVGENLKILDALHQCSPEFQFFLWEILKDTSSSNWLSSISDIRNGELLPVLAKYLLKWLPSEAWVEILSIEPYEIFDLCHTYEPDLLFTKFRATIARNPLSLNNFLKIIENWPLFLNESRYDEWLTELISSNEVTLHTIFSRIPLLDVSDADLLYNRIDHCILSIFCDIKLQKPVQFSVIDFWKNLLIPDHHGQHFFARNKSYLLSNITPPFLHFLITHIDPVELWNDLTEQHNEEPSILKLLSMTTEHSAFFETIVKLIETTNGTITIINFWNNLLIPNELGKTYFHQVEMINSLIYILNRFMELGITNAQIIQLFTTNDLEGNSLLQHIIKNSQCYLQTATNTAEATLKWLVKRSQNTEMSQQLSLLLIQQNNNQETAVNYFQLILTTFLPRPTIHLKSKIHNHILTFLKNITHHMTPETTQQFWPMILGTPGLYRYNSLLFTIATTLSTLENATSYLDWLKDLSRYIPFQEIWNFITLNDDEDEEDEKDHILSHLIKLNPVCALQWLTNQFLLPSSPPEFLTENREMIWTAIRSALLMPYIPGELTILDDEQVAAISDCIQQLGGHEELTKAIQAILTQSDYASLNSLFQSHDTGHSEGMEEIKSSDDLDEARQDENAPRDLRFGNR